MLSQQTAVPVLEETIVRLDGTPVEVEVTAAPFPSKGETGIHVVLSDISERKKAELAHQQIEEQLRHSQRMEAIGTLAGGIAHDFNNILTAIIGYAHISQMGLPPDAPQRAPIQQITEAANRATHLTRDLLLFSRK
jgi:signal transduction histidine kinase